jgi:hypothetical protein
MQKTETPQAATTHSGHEIHAGHGADTPGPGHQTPPRGPGAAGDGHAGA